MTDKPESDLAAFQELLLRNRPQAAEKLDANADQRRKQGDKGSLLAASLEEDAADRLRGGEGTISRR